MRVRLGRVEGKTSGWESFRASLQLALLAFLGKGHPSQDGGIFLWKAVEKERPEWGFLVCPRFLVFYFLYFRDHDCVGAGALECGAGGAYVFADEGH